MGRKKLLSYSHIKEQERRSVRQVEKIQALESATLENIKGQEGPSTVQVVKKDSKNFGPSATEDILNKRKKVLTDIYKGSIPHTKLNTKEFQAYLERIWMDVSDVQSQWFSYFDCLWWNHYVNPVGSKRKVLSWIKKKSIFSKKYIFVPICAWGHWFLVILCHFGESFNSTENPPCMLLLDSLLEANSNKIEPDLRKFVLDIYALEGCERTVDDIAAIPLMVPPVPQQISEWECGYFVLYFIYKFMQGAPSSFTQSGFPYFLTPSWFSQADIITFESELTVHDQRIDKEVENENEAENVDNIKEKLFHEHAEENEQMEEMDHPDFQEEEKKDEQDESTARRCRGHTTLRDVHGLKEDIRIKVQFNALGQPVGEGGRSLRSFMGTLARMGDKLPIDVLDWRAMPKVNKDDVWDYVKSMIASSDDAYAQVFGKERPGRIRGVGTGPTPSSLWGVGSSQVRLQEENRNLAQTVKELAEKLGKVEALVMEGRRRSGEDHASSPMCVQSSASIAKSVQVQGRKVTLLDLTGEEVGRGIIMSDEKEKSVMGMTLSGVFYEVVVFLAIKPEAPLFVKDADRKIMGDAVGSHIAWLKKYVRIDLA